MPDALSRAARPVRKPLLVEVVGVEQLTPHMVRVVFGGADLDGFGAGAFTDHYVKLQVPPVGANYSAPFDVEKIRASKPKSQWPVTRTYTIRSWDSESGELTIDFVVHGHSGAAGPWAAAAKVGDKLQLSGPGGAYAPDPEADWHLMIGDPSVIPAISASLARVPAGAPVRVVLQVDGEDDELPLESPGDLEVTWLHGGGDALLVEALRRLQFPRGRVHAFVHGEASAVRAVRKFLLVEQRVPREALSASGYWKRSLTEEGWREDKAEWTRQAEADVA